MEPQVVPQLIVSYLYIISCVSGDIRANVVPSLGFMHTIYIREHNRLTDKLKKENPHWNFDKLFQEARKIVAAEFQHITYNEYLPPILGHETMVKYKLLSTGEYTYNDTIDATIKNSFGAASFRFGHSQIPSMQTMLKEDFKSKQETPIEDTFKRPALIQENQGKGIPGFARWLVTEETGATDRYVILSASSVTPWLL